MAEMTGPEHYANRERIRRKREAKRLSQEEVAAKAGIGKKTYYNVETKEGKHKEVVLNSIAGVIGLTLRDVIRSDLHPSTRVPGLRDCGVEVVLNRSLFYKRAAELIADGKEIHDVSWGEDPKLDSDEEEAAAKYRTAKKRALTNHARYYELFAQGGWKKFQDRVNDAEKRAKEHQTYEFRVLEVAKGVPPPPDFVIVDASVVLLAYLHADRDGGRPGSYKHLVIHSRELSAFFMEIFWEWWRLCDKGPNRKKE